MTRPASTTSGTDRSPRGCVRPRTCAPPAARRAGPVVAQMRLPGRVSLSELVAALAPARQGRAAHLVAWPIPPAVDALRGGFIVRLEASDYLFVDPHEDWMTAALRLVARLMCEPVHPPDAVPHVVIPNLAPAPDGTAAFADEFVEALRPRLTDRLPP